MALRLHPRCITLHAVLAASLVAPSSGGEVAYHILAMTGQALPKPADAMQFGSTSPNDHVFVQAGVDARGEVVVLGRVSDGKRSVGQALLSGPAGGLRLVARSGDVLPGAAGCVCATLTSSQFGDANGLVFTAKTQCKDAILHGIWQATGEGCAPVTAGNAMAEMPGPSFGDRPLRCVVNAASLLIVLEDTPKGQCIWAGAAGSLKPVTRTGQSAPGTGSGVTFDRFAMPRPNSQGQIVFAARVRGTGVTARNDTGLWSGDPARLSLLASEGDVVPGSGETLGDFMAEAAQPAINNTGQIAFLTGSAVCVARPGEMTVAARSGEMSLDSPKGVKTLGRKPTIALLDDGRLLIGSQDGIWAVKPGVLRPILRKGEAAPGIDGGLFEGFGEFVFTQTGRLAFVGLLKQKTRGIWAGLPGNLQLIVRDDMDFGLAENDVRRILSDSLVLVAPGTVPGLGTPSPMNDQGDVVFRAAFEAIRGVRDRTEVIFLARASSGQ